MPVLVKYPTVVTTQSVLPEDDDNWVNPNNIKADDAAYASITAATFDSPDISYRIKAQGFDFSTIPDGTTIHGIIVEIERYNDSGETGADYRVQLLDASGALVGDNKKLAGNWETTPTVKSYGGTEDGWNAGLTSAMVKDPDFGVVLSVQATTANADIYVDYIRISVYYGTIDIGGDASDRNSSSGHGYTIVDKTNPSDGTGTITQVQVWAVNSLTGFRVGTFFLVSGTTYQCRDSETIGNVAWGSIQTFSGLSFAVTLGDFMGNYFTGGDIEFGTSGGSGDYYAAGEYIDPDDSASMALDDADAVLSCYGTGTEAAGAPANTVYIVLGTGRRTQDPTGASAIKVDSATGRRGTNTAFDRYLVKEDDGRYTAKVS